MNEITESQLDRIIGEWDDLSQINFESHKNDFYAEYKKQNENKKKESVTINGFPTLQTPRKNKVLIYNPNISDPETQIPFYTVERESMTGKPICMYQQETPTKNKIQLTPTPAIDLNHDEDFMIWLETVSLIRKPKGKSTNEDSNTLQFPKRNINEPMCISISDIHLINFDDDNKKSELIIYGQRCRLLTFYGRAFRINGKELHKTMRYEVDDGMGKIRVTFKHESDIIKSNELNYNSVHNELAEAKYGKKFVKNSKNYIPKNTIENLKTLLKIVRKRAEASLEYFKSGSKVLVIGFPFKLYGNTEIRAVEMFDDSGLDRTNELYFKAHLAKLYEEKYFKYSIDNKLLK